MSVQKPGRKLNDKRITSLFFAQHFTRSCNNLLQEICLKVGVQIRCNRNGRVARQIAQGHRVNAGGLSMLAGNRRMRLVTPLLEDGNGSTYVMKINLPDERVLEVTLKKAENQENRHRD